MSNFADLIARLEKATGPDRSLDALIAAATAVDDEAEHLAPGFSRSFEADEEAVVIWISGPNGHHRKEGKYAPAKYTGSLDAARQLVSGFYWVVSEGKTRDAEPLGGAQVFRRDYLVEPIAEAEHEKVEIALCIAALKVRSAQ